MCVHEDKHHFNFTTTTIYYLFCPTQTGPKSGPQCSTVSLRNISPLSTTTFFLSNKTYPLSILPYSHFSTLSQHHHYYKKFFKFSSTPDTHTIFHFILILLKPNDKLQEIFKHDWLLKKEEFIPFWN